MIASSSIRDNILQSSFGVTRVHHYTCILTATTLNRLQLSLHLHLNSTAEVKTTPSLWIEHFSRKFTKNIHHLSTNNMTHYNRPSEVSYNEEITSWRFRVKIHMSYPFYSYVTGSGPH